MMRCYLYRSQVLAVARKVTKTIMFSVTNNIRFLHIVRHWQLPCSSTETALRPGLLWFNLAAHAIAQTRWIYIARSTCFAGTKAFSKCKQLVVQMCVSCSYVMFFQFQAAVRAAFRTHYEIDNASLDTTLHQLNAVYIRSAWMPKHAILRAQGNFMVNNMFFVIFVIMFFIIFRNLVTGTTVLACCLQILAWVGYGDTL